MSDKAPQTKKKSPVLLILFLAIALFMSGLFYFVQNSPATIRTPIIK